jgi:modification methylase
MTATVHHGNGARMREIADGQAAVVFTGPPYFPADLEPLLARPRSQQSGFADLSRRIVAYALSLRPVFAEVRRVLAPHGVLIMQTKDLRYAGFLIGLAGVHRQLAESVGFALVTRVLWEPMFQQASQRARVPAGPAAPARMRVRETEEFLVMADPDSSGARPQSTQAPFDLAPDEVRDCLAPAWRMPAAGGSARHPHQSPPGVVRRLLALYSVPGDLVVDPFAGGAGILRVAAQMGRQAVGYEIDEARARIAAEALSSSSLELTSGRVPQLEAPQRSQPLLVNSSEPPASADAPSSAARRDEQDGGEGRS